jgi:hypothetical protein
MKVRTTIAGAGLSARLAVIGCGTMTILASAAVSACSGSTPSTSFSPAETTSPTPTVSSSSTASESASVSASPSASPSVSPSVTPTETHTALASATPSPSASPLPTAAPATGGGGTAGFQDTLLFTLGGAAVLAGAGSIAYRRKVIRNR